MAKRTPQRKPVRKPKRRRPTSAKGAKKVRKVSSDPAREYVLAMKAKLGGDAKKSLLQMPTLTGDELPCLSRLGNFLSTQQPSLDRMLDWFGFPLGKWIEVFGPEHIGKSTFLYHLFAEVQKQGGIGILVDIENAAIPKYVGNIGVDTDRLLMPEFDRDAVILENVVDLMYESIRWWRISHPEIPVVVGWDALGSTRTQEERDKGAEQGKKPGSAAKLMHYMKRKVVPELAGTNILLVVLNHEYDVVNMGGGGFGFGKKRETYGGGGQRLASAIRLKLFPKGDLKNSAGQIIGRQVGVEAKKDKIFGSYRDSADMCIIPHYGFVPEWSLYQEFVKAGVIKTSGSWAALNMDGDELKFQGWLGLHQKTKEDPTLLPRLIKVYRSVTGG